MNLSTVYHGVATPVKVDEQKKSPLFVGLPPVIEVGRYHSWIVSDEDFPPVLEVTARDENNYIMALQHKKYCVSLM